MNEPTKNPFQPLFDEFRRIVREEIAAALGDSKQAAIVKEWLSAKECGAIRATADMVRGKGQGRGDSQNQTGTLCVV